MPALLVFAACEKVIISQDENNPTLISLLTDLGVDVEVEQEPVGNIIVPSRWAVFSLWRVKDGDDGKTFEQMVRIIPPSGGKSLVGDAVSEWKFTGQTHRITMHIPGVPSSKSGEWAVQCFLREAGQDWPKSPVATYPLNIHVVIKSNPKAPAKN
jgi:hypothetical protein